MSLNDRQLGAGDRLKRPVQARALSRNMQHSCNSAKLMLSLRNAGVPETWSSCLETPVTKPRMTLALASNMLWSNKSVTSIACAGLT